MKTKAHSLKQRLYMIWITTLILVAFGFATQAKADEVLQLDLEQSLNLALEHSWTLKERTDETLAAQYRRKQVRGYFLPKLDARARYTKLSEVEPMTISLPQMSPDQPAPEPMQLGDPIDEQYSLRLSVEQPIFSGGAIINGYRAARSAEKAGQSLLQKENEDLRLQVELSYFYVITTRQLQKVALQSVGVLESHQKRVGHLYEAGRLTRFEFVETKSRLAQAISSLVAAESRMKTAELTFVTMLGLPEGTVFDLADLLGNEQSSIPAFEELITPTMSNNPDIQATQYAADALKKQSYVALADMFPKLVLTGGYNYDNPNERYFPPENEFNDSWDVSLVLNWNFWSWGADYYKSRAAKAEARAAEHRLSRVQETIKTLLFKTMQDLRQGEEAILAARSSVEASEEALRLAEEQFKVGRLTSTIVLEKELDYSQAETQLVKAVSDQRIAMAELRRIIGQADFPKAATQL